MDLFDLQAKIGLDTSEYERGVDGALSVGMGLASKLGTVFAAIGKAAVAGTALAATGVAALSKQALDSYASYEQLVGGVDTLFKESSATVQQYAANAFQTAGMSANEYMSTVTNFSASLIQSLGGDTKAAAELANQAVTDMSDSANKMGTSLSSLQDAYRGFSRGNYTMLDNLALGYGGTQEEMQRLLADAEKLSGVHYELGNFGDMIEAIHVVQTEMGITGTTAAEAATTIQGSVGMMQGAWQNLLTGVADSTQNLPALIDQFVASVQTVGGNVLPRLQEIFQGIGQLVTELAPTISGALPGLVSTVVPPLIEAAASMVGAIAQGLAQAAPAVVQQIPEIVRQIVGGLAKAAPDVLQAGREIVTMLGEGLIQNGPTLLQSAVDTAVGLINGLAAGAAQAIPQFLAQALPMLMQFTGQLRANAGQLIDAGLNLILELGNGIIAAIPTLIETVPTIVSNIAGIINDNAPKLLITAGTLIWNLAAGLIEAIPTLVANIPQIIQAVVDVFTAFNWVQLGGNLIKGVGDGIKNFGGSVKTAVQNIINSVKGFFQNGWNAIKNSTNGIFGAIKSVISGALNTVKTNVSNVLNAIKGVFSSAWNLVKSVVTGNINGIKTSISTGLNAARSVVTSVLNAIRNTFSNVLNGAKTIVSNAISAIKSKFNFSWSLPKLKLPHLSITGKFSITPPSVPRFSIRWYRDAMDSPMLLTNATIFGAAGGSLLGAGEAGPEVVSGADTLMDMISAATAATLQPMVREINSNFSQLFGILAEYFPQFSNSQIILDNGVLVGQMAPAMDMELGRIGNRRQRGL